MSVWTRGDVLANARQQCSTCYGLGFVAGSDRVCACVLRAIFRGVLARVRVYSEERGYTARVSLGSANGARKAGSFSFRTEEFLADFALVSKRALGGAGTRHWRLFAYHYLLGADWKLCTRRLGITRGEFFHECYRVEAKLGRAYKETQPYALWPLDEYFSSNRRGRPHPIFRVEVAPEPRTARAPRFPLACAAA